MKIQPTFFNTRNERFHWGFNDTNNWLFTIIYRHGLKLKEQNYILRDVKQDKSIIDYIYKKIYERFEVVEIAVGKLSKTEYDMLININTPTIYNCVKTEPLFRKKLSKTKTGCRQNNELQIC